MTNTMVITVIEIMNNLCPAELAEPTDRLIPDVLYPNSIMASSATATS